MKRFLTATLLLLALVAGGGIVYQQSAERRLSAELQEITTTIATQYQTLTNDLVAPLEASGKLNADQQSLLLHIRDVSDDMMHTSSILEKIKLISAVQKALTAIASRELAGENGENDPRFAQLQEEIGERGAVTDDLQSYNDIAAHWNARTHSLLGSLMGSVTNTQEDRLPYLKFDGSQEYVPTIRL